MVDVLLITILAFPVYLVLRHPYRRLPPHIDTGFYVPNQLVATGRLAYSEGWNARYAGGSKVLPELFYSLAYLAHGGKDYASCSRLYFSTYNYMTAVAVGVLAWLVSGGDVSYYYAGLAVFALLSSEPHWGGYHESGEQFEVLPQVLSVICLLVGLGQGSAWWCGLAAFIWAAQAFAIKLTSALGFVILFGATAWTRSWIIPPVLLGGGLATICYLVWLVVIGKQLRRLLASMWGLQASQSGHFDAVACVHRLYEKSRRLATTCLRQPIVPLLVICGLMLGDSPPDLIWWYMVAVAAVYVGQGADIRYYQIPLWPPLALLGAQGAVWLADGTTIENLALAGLLAAWLGHNVIRAYRSDVRALNVWSWSGALSPEECDRNLALTRCATEIRSLVQERSMLVYGPHNQAYALTGASYPTSMVCAAHWLDDMAPDWQRHLSRRIVVMTPEAILDTQRCFDAAAVRGELGVDYELRRIFPGDFRLYLLCAPARPGSPTANCRSYAPQSREQLILEELRMTLRKASEGDMRAANWGLLADDRWLDVARQIAARVKISLTFCSADPQTVLERLCEVDVVAVLDPAGGDGLDRLAESAGRRLIYRAGQFDCESAQGADDQARLRRVLGKLQLAGCRRVGIYGAGRKTASLIDVLIASPVEILAIFDDDTRRHGERLSRWPIHPLSDLGNLGVEAIVVCSDRFEAPMLRRCRQYERRGITVVGLYRKRSAPAQKRSGVFLEAPY